MISVKKKKKSYFLEVIVFYLDFFLHHEVIGQYFVML